MTPLLLNEQDLTQFIQQYFLPFCRIGAMFLAMPILGSKLVSPRVRLGLAFLVTLIVVPMLGPLPKVDALSFHTIIFVSQELLLGLAAGYCFQVVFQVFVLAGQLIAMKMGLGFASMNDPVNGVQTTAISQFYLMLVTLMFVSVNGHLVMINMLVDSFSHFPPGGFVFSTESMWKIANIGSWLFASALLMALPVLTSLLFINIAFGVMSRAAPQLNIFAVGFPFTLLCGLLLIWLGLTTFSTNFDMVMEDGFIFLHELLRQP